jgi:hypothetical protein
VFNCSKLVGTAYDCANASKRTHTIAAGERNPNHTGNTVEERRLVLVTTENKHKRQTGQPSRPHT